MIESAVLENLTTGASVVLNDNTFPMQQFSTSVEVRGESRNKPLRHGAFEGYTYYGVRTFSIEGDLLAQSSAQYMQRRIQLYSALSIDTTALQRVPFKLRMRFTGMTEELISFVTLDGYPELPMVAGYPSFGSYMINFKSFDPWMLSETTYQAIAGTPGITSGVSYPKTYPFSYGSVTGGGDIIINNTGNISTSPSVTIQGPVSNPELILMSEAGSPSLIFDEISLSASESMVVDFENRAATVNTGENVYGNVTHTSTWWDLPPGNNTIRFGAFAASAPAKATFVWRNAYMI